VWFAYSEDRKGEHPRRHLKDFKGALQADAYSGFHHLYGDGAIYEVARWAHAKRKFHDIHVAHASPTTTEAMARIGALYRIEEEIRGKPAELRCSVRQTRARLLLDNLRHWNSAITCRCIGSSRSMPVKALISVAPLWPDGLARARRVPGKGASGRVLGSAGFGVASQPSGEPARLTTAHQKENSLDAHPRGANCSPLTELSRNHTPSGIGEKSARLQATLAKVSMS
jgi:hypothetical protein